MQELDTSRVGQRDGGRRLATLAAVALVAGLLMGAFTGLRLAAHDGDLSVFVDAGDRTTDPASAPEHLTVGEDTAGYDGQIFYRLARNPLTEGRREFGVELVRPEYRHARIGYPLAAWALSAGGREDLVLGALVAVNVLAVAAVAGLAAALARDAGRSPWWGLLTATWAGLFVALARDLAEPVAVALLLAAVVALRRRRWVWSVVALSLAALTRETTLVLALAVLGSHLAGRWQAEREGAGDLGGLADRVRAIPVAVGIVPFVVYGAWRAFLRWWWGPGADAANAPESFFTTPFTALVRQLWEWSTGLGTADAGDLLQFVQLLLVLGVLACYVAAAVGDRGAGLPHERLALVGFLVVLTMVPAWDRSVVFLRWPAEAVAVGTAVVLSARGEVLRRLVMLSATLTLVTVPVWVSIA